jgi:hypothetical protein
MRLPTEIFEKSADFVNREAGLTAQQIDGLPSESDSAQSTL